MKRIAVVIVALAALPCMPALTYAQGDKPAAKPADKPAAAAPAAKAAAAPAAKPADKPAASRVGRSRAARDARECLQLATNTEIIKCAEKYR